MLEINLPINQIKTYNNFSIEEKTPVIKINLRGNPNNKDFTGKDAVPLHYNKRRHEFSTSTLRSRVVANTENFNADWRAKWN